jgi:hypothetical protein
MGGEVREFLVILGDESDDLLDGHVGTSVW